VRTLSPTFAGFGRFVYRHEFTFLYKNLYDYFTSIHRIVFSIFWLKSVQGTVYKPILIFGQHKYYFSGGSVAIFSWSGGRKVVGKKWWVTGICFVWSHFWLFFNNSFIKLNDLTYSIESDSLNVFKFNGSMFIILTTICP